MTDNEADELRAEVREMRAQVQALQGQINEVNQQIEFSVKWLSAVANSVIQAIQYISLSLKRDRTEE